MLTIFYILRRAHQEHRSKVRRGHACEGLHWAEEYTEYWWDEPDSFFADQNTSVNTKLGTEMMKKINGFVTVLVP